MAFKTNLAHFWKQTKNISSQPTVSVTVNSTLSRLTNYLATAATPKSRVELVYSITEYVDITVAFAYHLKSKFLLSKGLSKCLGKKFLKQEEWDLLATVDDFENVKFLSYNNKLIFIVAAGQKQFHYFCHLVREINNYANLNYTLVLGVDIYKIPGFIDFPCLETLSLVVENEGIKFVFYNKGARDITFLTLAARGCPLSSNCPAGFFPEDTKHHVFLNMMIELQNLLAFTDNANAAIYRKILTQVETNNTGALGRYKLSMNFYDNNLCKYLFPTERSYGHGFSNENGGKFVIYESSTKKFNTSARYILTTKDTELMLNGKLCSAMAEVDISTCTLPNIEWVDGVPGCGKTTYIVSSHRPGNDLILTQTRAGVKDVRLAVSKQFGPESEKRLNIDYRTVSSFLINGSDRKYERVFVDEALLMHAGYVGYIAKLSGAKTICLLGDSKQIPYIERSKLSCRWSNISLLIQPNELLSVSKRCPIDVCFLLSSYYEKICTTNPICRSICPTITDGSFHHIDKKTLILTFTQSEKKALVEALLKKAKEMPVIHTVHESQGLTSPNVLLIRIDQRPLEIYDSVPHIIVALSRHTHNFRYLTNASNDLTQQLITKVTCVDDTHLINWNQSFLGATGEDLATTKYSDVPSSFPCTFLWPVKSLMRRLYSKNGRHR